MLLAISGENQLVTEGGSGRIRLERDHEIELETVPPSDEVKYCRAVLRIKLTVSGMRDKDEAPKIRVGGAYEARFVFSEESTIEEVDTVAATEAFQYALSAQVIPLAMAHIKDQLELMGLTTQRMPLGV